MVKRIITALFMIACIIPPLVFGGIWIQLLLGIIVVIGGFEMMELLESYKKTSKLLFLALLLIICGMLFVDTKYIVVLFGLITLTMMALPVFTSRINSRDAIMLSGILILFFTFAKSFLVIYDLNPLYVWFILIATFACDTGAYFSGYFLGKHKLCERISPKKTIEGSVGGILFSWLLSFLFVLFVFKDANLYLVIAGALVMPIVSQIGDLSFSAIKRLYDIKDFSNIFPGHGGFMDRIDSLVYNLVVFYALVMVIM